VAVWVECQWCGNYYVRKDALQDDDPEVFADECGDTRNGAGYHGTGIGWSKFLWAYYIAFNVSGGPISHQVELNCDEYQRLKDILVQLPVLSNGCQSCRTIQAYRSDFLSEDEAMICANDGVMGYLTRGQEASSMHLRSKMQRAVDKFLTRLNIDPSRLQDSF
jgi:hypothetical protein